jgi:threonylcarbamoyladenosine tRNA methylthiotransferase MtaB
MKRRHTAQAVFDGVERARKVRRDVVFGADLIAGFPTETDQQFEAGLEAITELGFAHLHVFHYSERQGTPAAKMPSVEKNVRKQRAERLRRAGHEAMTTFLESRVGTDADILLEKDGQGLSEHYVPVHIASSHPAETGVGDLLRVHIGAFENGQLQGTLNHE